MCAFSHESSVALTPPDLGLPADILDDLGWLFPSPWQMSADLGGIAGGPGAFHQSLSGLGVTSFGQSNLLAPRTRGIRCRDHAQAWHQCSGGIDTAEVAHFSHHRDGHGALLTAPGLKSFDHRVHTPRFHVLLACWFETLESFAVFGDGSDIFVKDDLVRWCRADHCSEPPEMGRAPMGPAGVADIVSASERVASTRSVLKMAEGLFTCPRAVS
jgi:hypothetical protein